MSDEKKQWVTTPSTDALLSAISEAEKAARQCSRDNPYASDELFAVTMQIENAKRLVPMHLLNMPGPGLVSVKADAGGISLQINGEQSTQAATCGKPCNCSVDAQTRTPWSLGSAVSGSSIESHWLARHRPGTADGSGYAEGEKGPPPQESSEDAGFENLLRSFAGTMRYKKGTYTPALWAKNCAESLGDALDGVAFPLSALKEMLSRPDSRTADEIEEACADVALAVLLVSQAFRRERTDRFRRLDATANCGRECRCPVDPKTGYPLDRGDEPEAAWMERHGMRAITAESREKY